MLFIVKLLFDGNFPSVLNIDALGQRAVLEAAVLYLLSHDGID